MYSQDLAQGMSWHFTCQGHTRQSCSIALDGFGHKCRYRYQWLRIKFKTKGGKAISATPVWRQVWKSKLQSFLFSFQLLSFLLPHFARGAMAL